MVSLLTCGTTRLLKKLDSRRGKIPDQHILQGSTYLRKQNVYISGSFPLSNELGGVSSNTDLDFFMFEFLFYALP